MSYDSQDPTTWAHAAAAQPFREWTCFNCLGEVVVGCLGAAGDANRGFLRPAWKSLSHGPDDRGRPQIARDEVEEAVWSAARDRGLYWDLDKLAECDLAVAGRWPQ